MDIRLQLMNRWRILTISVSIKNKLCYPLDCNLISEYSIICPLIWLLLLSWFKPYDTMLFHTQGCALELLPMSDWKS